MGLVMGRGPGRGLIIAWPHDRVHSKNVFSIFFKSFFLFCIISFCLWHPEPQSCSWFGRTLPSLKKTKQNRKGLWVKEGSEKLVFVLQECGDLVLRCWVVAGFRWVLQTAWTESLPGQEWLELGAPRKTMNKIDLLILQIFIGNYAIWSMGDRHKQGLTPVLGKPLSNEHTLAMHRGQREEDGCSEEVQGFKWVVWARARVKMKGLPSKHWIWHPCLSVCLNCLTCWEGLGSTAEGHWFLLVVVA